VEAIRFAKTSGGRVLVVGTTSLRALEAAADFFSNFKGKKKQHYCDISSIHIINKHHHFLTGLQL